MSYKASPATTRALHPDFIAPRTDLRILLPSEPARRVPQRVTSIHTANPEASANLCMVVLAARPRAARQPRIIPDQVLDHPRLRLYGGFRRVPRDSQSGTPDQVLDHSRLPLHGGSHQPLIRSWITPAFRCMVVFAAGPRRACALRTSAAGTRRSTGALPLRVGSRAANVPSEVPQALMRRGAEERRNRRRTGD